MSSDDMQMEEVGSFQRLALMSLCHCFLLFSYFSLFTIYVEASRLGLGREWKLACEASQFHLSLFK